MRSMLAGVPPLLYLAVVCAGLAVWSQDVRGIYIAAVCAVLGLVQLVVSDPARTPPRDRPDDYQDPWSSTEA